MLIDLHAHSSGISKCCKISFDQVLQQTLDNGMDGIILTNHYQKSYLGDEPVEDFAKRYIAEYHAAKEYGERIGCKVFFGIEVTMELYHKVHMLIYGVDTAFLSGDLHLFDKTQEELYALVHARGGLLVQAHPFRGGTTVLDTAFMDGVEINCHPKYDRTYAEELTQIAQKDRLFLTCGGDFHNDTYRPRCGMFLPDDICDAAGIRSYLLSAEKKRFCIQEPHGDANIVEI